MTHNDPNKTHDINDLTPKELDRRIKSTGDVSYGVVGNELGDIHDPYDRGPRLGGVDPIYTAGPPRLGGLDPIYTASPAHLHAPTEEELRRQDEQERAANDKYIKDKRITHRLDVKSGPNESADSIPHGKGQQGVAASGDVNKAARAKEDTIKEQEELKAAGYGDILTRHGEKNGGIDGGRGRDTIAAEEQFRKDHPDLVAKYGDDIRKALEAYAQHPTNVKTAHVSPHAGAPSARKPDSGAIEV